MTVLQSFIQFLEQQGCGTFGQNIFAWRVPNSLKTPTDIFWVIPSGGMPSSSNQTGEKIKDYQFILYFRSNEAKKVDATLNALEETLNCSGCVQLKDFELVSMVATQFPSDQDLDSENRVVGFLQIQLSVYKSC